MYLCIKYNSEERKRKVLYCVCVCVSVVQTPKLEAAKRSEAETLVEAVVWA